MKIYAPDNTFYCIKCFDGSYHSGYTSYYFGDNKTAMMGVSPECDVCCGNGIMPIPLTEVGVYES